MAVTKHKVLITTSGIGQRLGEITEHTNKALVRIGKKPVLSHIIESYPKGTNFVITVGYLAEQIIDFVKITYPSISVEFVKVDNYEGKGSSLGYSMLCAKSKLQCPFIYHACDTIISGVVPKPNKNWIGVFEGDDSAQYASWTVSGDSSLIFNDKGAIDFDYIHIGIVGIKDYKSFWKVLNLLYKENPMHGALNDCEVINYMMNKNQEFKLVNFEQWFDMGNTASLNDARKNVSNGLSILDKVDESIFIFKDFVVKFFSNKEIVKNRVERAKILKGLVPKIENSVGNFYRYPFIKGNLYSRVVTPKDFKKFLDWAKSDLWVADSSFDKNKFKKATKRFYYNKTVNRVEKFLKANSLLDENNIINGEKVPTVSEMLSQIDFKWLCDSKPYKIHGDFVLDNIIKTNKGWTLLDWRQDFGGLIEVGDMYYDLAKANHNLTVNHDIVNDDLFTINIKKNIINCDILRKNNLVECRDVLFNFIQEEGYDAKKVELLTALIWLNMSPLHHHPFNLFLYYFGKLHLWKAIKNLK